MLEVGFAARADDLVEGGLVGEEYVSFEPGPKCADLRRFDQAD
jgi:hypothetical protein